MKSLEPSVGTVEGGIDDSKAEIDSESIKDRVKQESMIKYNNYLK